MATNQPFYPSLTDLLSPDQLPVFLQGIEGGIENALKDFYYTDYFASTSFSKDKGFYRFTVFAYNGVGINIPGTELKLLVNPSVVPGAGNVSEFSATMSYYLPIIGYLDSADLSSFTGTPQQYFDLVLDMFAISADQFLAEVIYALFQSTDPIQDFVNQFNVLNPLHTITPISGEPLEVIVNLTEQISSIPGVDLFQKLFEDFLSRDLSIQEIIDRLEKVLKKWTGRIDFKKFIDLFIPKFALSIEEMSLGLQFPSNIFRQLDPSTQEPLVDGAGNNIGAVLKFNVGGLQYSTETGFDFKNENSFDFPLSEISRTGLTISVNNLKLDLSRTRNIPEAVADNRPSDFIGAYIMDGTIGFPTFWNHNDGDSTGELKVRNLLVGTGGISGTIGLEAKTGGDPSPLIKANFGGGFSVSLDAFSITFQQNAIVESQIHGTMKIPGFKDSTGADAEINIDVWIGTNGEFSVTASEDQSITALSIPSIFDLTFKSLSVGRKQNRFYVAVSGNIDFHDQGGTIGKFLPEDIEIRKLIIWQDGEIELDGGQIELPKAMTFSLPPVELSITGIGLGSYEQRHEGQLRKYKFFEFSGGISINPGGIDARGDGVKFYYTTDNGPGKPLHTFMRIQGISIDLTITNKSEETILLLKGYLAMKNPAEGNEEAGTEYAGGIDFGLPKLEMGGSAAMRLNPKVPAFIVDIGLEISTPIPLGTTGLGIYGFRALLGQRYVATRPAAGVPEDGEWWQYYKAKTDPDFKEGIYPAKFDQTDGFSLGAGVSLATSVDSGKAFSSKLFFLLSLPEVFLFQGQGQILKERIGLDSVNDPPFFAMIAISKASVEAAFGINYKMPDDNKPGSIAKVDALVEMGFFFGNASAWYINVGRDLPESRRVNVRLFDLFDSYFYLMLSSSGIRAGAGSKFEIEKKFGPLRAELGAYLDIAGKIAFKPKQYGASIQLGGKVGLYIFKFGFSISVDAALAGEAPQPFIITGSLKVCIQVLKKERCAKFEFTWIRDNTLDTGEIALMDPNVAVKAVNMMTRETFDLLPVTGSLSTIHTTPLNNFTIPMDSYIDLEFLKGVLPSSEIRDAFGGNTQAARYVEYVSPQKAKSSQVRHEYHLHKVRFYCMSDNDGWVPYDIYDAATPLSEATFVTADLSALKKGYWQYQQPDLHNKLRIMAQSPLSFVSQGTGNVIVEELGITDTSLFCAPGPSRKICIDFKDFGDGTEYGEVLATIPDGTLQYAQGFFAKIAGSDAHVVYQPYGRYNNALALKPGSTMELIFIQPQAQVILQLRTVAYSTKVHYYKRVELPELTPGNLPQFDYELVETRTIASEDLSDPVEYGDIDNAIVKVVVEACECGEALRGSASAFCTGITAQASDLVTFLNQILTDKDDVPLELYPALDADYNGIFQGTSLYPSITDENTVLEFSVVSVTDLTLEFLITDNHGYSCTISFTADSGINWSIVTGFENIQPYTTAPGLNYEFKIDVTMLEGGSATIRGVSCYPIIECFDDCSLFIYRICHLSFADAQSNLTLPDEDDVQEETDIMLEGFRSSIQPIWRPNTYYLMEVLLEDKLFKDAETSELTRYENQYFFGFRTKGPIGYFHEGNPQYQALLSSDREAEFKLASLQHYIDYSKSYPNADGALIQAKPLFFIEPELTLFYLKNYVYEFYRNWDAYAGNEGVEILLETIIKDPAPDTTVPPMASIPVEWVANDLIHIPELDTIASLFSNGRPCVDISKTAPIGVNSVVSIDQLEPLKLYTAIFNARYKLPGETEFTTQEVHRYVFQTSRYGSFTEQVNSYILETDPLDPLVITREAVFKVDIELYPGGYTLAQEIMSNTLDENSSLRQLYAEDYDKLINGLFKLGTLHPAATTEFNIVKDLTSGNVLGILVRNPEPFNIPTMPDDILWYTVDAVMDATPLGKKLFSKDKRNLFITNENLNLAGGNCDFTFTYMQWTGSGYDTQAVVALTIHI